jgi:glycosyltransferase involved in cell wall biosynthesis
MIVVQLTTDNREPFRQYDRPQPWFGAAPKALLQGFAECPDVQVHVVACTQQPMINSPDKLGDNIWFHELHVPRLGWLRTGYLGCIRAVQRKIREIAPDIVHGQGTERDCALSAIFSGFPNVVTIHGNMAALALLFRARIGSYYWLTARLEDFTLRRTRGVFCNSGYTEELVRPRAPRTWRVPNAIRREFVSDPPTRAPSQCAVILNVGVISPRKRQVELLECARRLHQAGVRLEWHFVGSADESEPYAARFLALLKDAEAAGYARYFGTRSTEEILRCFDAAVGLVHFPTEEAFGLVVAEALARNLKFFGSDLGGIAEIARGVECAELFDVEDWAGLEAAIRRWVAQGFATPNSAAPTMHGRYAPVVVARRHLEIYREVLSKRA